MVGYKKQDIWAKNQHTQSANIWLSRIIRIFLIFFKNMYLCSLGDHFWQLQFFYMLYSNIMPNIWHLFIKFSDFLRLCWFLAKNTIFYDPPSKTFHNRTDTRLFVIKHVPWTKYYLRSTWKWAVCFFKIKPWQCIP